MFYPSGFEDGFLGNKLTPFLGLGCCWGVDYMILHFINP
jgi:hypothetical protein